MNFVQCVKCKLTLPRHVLNPVTVTGNGKKRRLLICEYCKIQLEKKFKEGKL